MEIDKLNAILNFAAVIVFECLFTVAGILAFSFEKSLLAGGLFGGAFVVFILYFIKKILKNISEEKITHPLVVEQS